MVIVSPRGAIDDSSSEETWGDPLVFGAGAVEDGTDAGSEAAYDVSTDQSALNEMARRVVEVRGRVPPEVEVVRGGEDEGERQPIVWGMDYDGPGWGRTEPRWGDPEYVGPVDLHPSLRDVGVTEAWRVAQRYNPRCPDHWLRYGRAIPPEEAVFEVRDRYGDWHDFNYGPLLTVRQEVTPHSFIYLGERHCRAVRTVMYNDGWYEMVCGRLGVLPSRRCDNPVCNQAGRGFHPERGYFRRFPVGIFDEEEHGWGNQYTNVDEMTRLRRAMATRRSPRLDQAVPREVSSPAERRVSWKTFRAERLRYYD